MYVCMYVCMYVGVGLCMHVCMYVCKYRYASIGMSMYVCMYVIRQVSQAAAVQRQHRRVDDAPVVGHSLVVGLDVGLHM